MYNFILRAKLKLFIHSSLLCPLEFSVTVKKDLWNKVPGIENTEHYFQWHFSWHLSKMCFTAGLFILYFSYIDLMLSDDLLRFPLYTWLFLLLWFICRTHKIGSDIRLYMSQFVGMNIKIYVYLRYIICMLKF